jgi:hypothetical protein
MIYIDKNAQQLYVGTGAFAKDHAKIHGIRANVYFQSPRKDARELERPIQVPWEVVRRG